MAESLREKNEDLSLRSLLDLLWGNRLWIVLGTSLAAGLGLSIAFLTPAEFHSTAVIAPKETGGGSPDFASQLGRLGGALTSSLNFGNNSLDRLEIVVMSREVAEMVIVQNDLLPKLFPEAWDAKSKTWKKDLEEIPTMRSGIDMLRGDIIAVTVNPKKKILEFTAKIYEPALSRQIVEFYLEALNQKIRNEVRADADLNRKYLEGQIEITVDPLVREKIQNLAAMEIEKSMLVSSKSFDILEKPVDPLKRSKPRRTQIMLLSIMGGLGFSVFSILALKGVKSVLA